MPVFSLSATERLSLNTVSAWASASESRRGRLDVTSVRSLVAAVERWQNRSEPDTIAAELRSFLGGRSVTRDEAKMLKQMLRFNQEDCAYPSHADMEEALEWDSVKVRRVFSKLVDAKIIKSEHKGNYPYELVPAIENTPVVAESPNWRDALGTPSNALPASNVMYIAGEIGAFSSTSRYEGTALDTVSRGDPVRVRTTDGNTYTAIASRPFRSGEAVFMTRDFGDQSAIPFGSEVLIDVPNRIAYHSRSSVLTPNPPRDFPIAPGQVTFYTQQGTPDVRTPESVFAALNATAPLPRRSNRGG